MAIEIKELLIKASIDNTSGSPPEAVNPEANEALVKQCVEQVLRVLQRQRSR